MMTRYQILNVDVLELGIDELVMFSGEVKRAGEDYERVGLSVPDWLSGKQKDADRMVEQRIRDEKERLLKKAYARRETLKTDTDKRKDADAEIARLEKELAD